MIGKNSFTKHRGDWPKSINPDRHFHLENCERLRELKMGRYSFSDYSVCEIEKDSSLGVLGFGNPYEGSYNFYWASLELKSDYDGMK